MQSFVYVVYVTLDRAKETCGILDLILYLMHVAQIILNS